MYVYIFTLTTHFVKQWYCTLLTICWTVFISFSLYVYNYDLLNKENGENMNKNMNKKNKIKKNVVCIFVF